MVAQTILLLFYLINSTEGPSPSRVATFKRVIFYCTNSYTKSVNKFEYQQINENSINNFSPVAQQNNVIDNKITN